MRKKSVKILAPAVLKYCDAEDWKTGLNVEKNQKSRQSQTKNEAINQSINTHTYMPF